MRNSIKLATASKKLLAAKGKMKALKTEIETLKETIRSLGGDIGRPDYAIRNAKIYQDKNAGLTIKDLSKKFNLSEGRIKEIYKREEYKEKKKIKGADDLLQDSQKLFRDR